MLKTYLIISSNRYRKIKWKCTYAMAFLNNTSKNIRLFAKIFMKNVRKSLNNKKYNNQTNT